MIVRPPAVSGRFYPGDGARLADEVDRLLEEAGGPEGDEAFGPLALIVPHAAYQYSGRVAARAWSRAAVSHPEVVVLVGPDHFTGYPHIALYAHGAFATPLGEVEIDEDLARSLLGMGHPLMERPEVHDREHSLEVQIPFVQRLFPGSSIVPILMGHRSAGNIEALAAALATQLPGRKALLVASSDLSHYHPRERAGTLDARVIHRVDELDPAGLSSDLSAGEAEACGGDPIVSVLSASRSLGARRSHVLDYADSGRVNGDTSSVVGYMAASIDAGTGDVESPLTREEEALLADIARESVTRAVRHEEQPLLPDPLPSGLARPAGVFVTIRHRGELRGCIGVNQAASSLAESVREAARSTVLYDQRFEKIVPAELGSLSLDISILGEFRPAIPGTIEPGRHGLLVSQGERRGLLLPQVAAEHGWGEIRFLEETCRKAGLPRDAWRKGARVEMFETHVVKATA